ncbi:MAG: hypothetical protein HUJ84_02360 [Veillonella sp.]|nr:hypothetical protein [Veillonella sp.]MCF0156201.1 hypothetical protein [Veillonella sp.]
MKKFAVAMTMALSLSVGLVGATNYWNGNSNYPEVAYSAQGDAVSYFDKASLFTSVDSSRNFVFGMNVVTMHNGQYGEATSYKFVVVPGMNVVARYGANGQPYQIQPGSYDWNVFQQAWKLAYGVDFH